MITDQLFVNKIAEKFHIGGVNDPVVKSIKKTKKDKTKSVEKSVEKSILDVYNLKQDNDLNISDDEIPEYFVYKGTDYFQHSITSYKSLKINIIFYSIYVHNHIPFVMFLMYKYPKVSKDYNELITFPHFISTKDIETELQEKERMIFKSYKQEKNFNYLKEGDEIYVLCEQDSTGFDLNLNRNSSWWWCLPFELVNLKKILGFSVDDKIVNFLLKYDKLMYVYTQTNNMYETPCIGYKLLENEELNYTIEIGSSKNRDHYFLSYEGVYEFIRKNIKSKKINLIRYIVFLHNNKVVNKDFENIYYKKNQSIIVNDLKTNFSKIYILNDFQELILSNHFIMKDEIETEENII